jgi:ribokinase
MSAVPATGWAEPDRSALADVVVFGSLNVDLVAEVAALPRPGETVTCTRFRQSRGGKGANQAVAARRLGARVAMVGAVGEDAQGQQLVRGLSGEGIDTTGVRRAGGGTGMALILLSASGENVITVVPGANHTLGEPDVRAAVAALRPHGVLLCQLEVPLPAVVSAVRRARCAGARVVLNAAPVLPLPSDLLAHVDVLLVNQAEAEALTGGRIRCAADAAAAGRRRAAEGAGSVVVTLGADGAVVVGGGAAVTVPSYRVRAVDTVGAGDAFAGAVAAELVAGSDLVTAARVGAAAGAVAVQRHGAQEALPYRQELSPLLSAGPGAEGEKHAP